MTLRDWESTGMVLGWIDLFGFAASGLTLATFAQRAMLPMRVLAIGANLCFIAYGLLGGLLPVLALHVMLLPLNLVRLGGLVKTRTAPEFGDLVPRVRRA